MRAAIVYCSQTRHTEKYTRWLAGRLGCEATPFAKRASVNLDAIDVLTFCSWFHAASIKGSKWLKREMAAHPGLDVILLATGATPMPGTGWSNEEEIEQAFRRFFSKDDYPDLPHFYCHGGYDFEKLGAVDKAAMRMSSTASWACFRPGPASSPTEHCPELRNPTTRTHARHEALGDIGRRHLRHSSPERSSPE